MTDPVTLIFGIAVLILSVVVHEVAHGVAADKLGDPTARMAGRLTMNPIKHLDLLGSFIVPALTALTGGFIFGWAKPVPYNPYNISHRHGGAIVAVAGPGSNILLALLFGLPLRFLELPDTAVAIMATIVLINIILAIFNLIPIPPLDGSKILFSFLPSVSEQTLSFFERYGLILVFFVIIFLWQLLLPVVGWLFNLITGIGF